MFEKYKLQANLYVGNFRPDDWWFTTYVAQVSEQQLPPHIVRAHAAINQTLRDVATNCDDPEARAIASTYADRLGAGICGRDSKGHWSQSLITVPNQKVGISFIGQKDSASSTAYAQTIPGTGIVFQGRPYFASPLDQGVVVHEFGHRLSIDRGRYPSPTTLKNDAYVDEEISRHSLEMRVTDWASNHQLLPALDQVIANHQVKSWREAIYSMTNNDYFSLALVADEPCPSLESARHQVVAFSAYIAIRYIQTNITLAKQQTELRAMYRVLRNMPSFG